MGNPRKVHIGLTQKDYYKHYRANGGTVNRDLYPKVLNAYFASMKEDLFDRREITLPLKFGTLRIQKYQPELKFDDDGKLINKAAVDIASTHKLWERDPEAKEKRVLVRYRNLHSDGFIFKIHWVKGKIPNLFLFSHKKNRVLSRELAHKIKNENYDTYIR